MILNKIQRLAKKAFSSKTYVLAVINRFLPDTLGRVADLEIDRDAKLLFVSLRRDDERSDVQIERYGIRYSGSRSFITFDTLKADGFLKPKLKTALKNREIEVDPRYVKLLQKLIRA
jgi:hypothetical protein